MLKDKNTCYDGIVTNIDAKRDWGDARDYVWGMWLMLQQDEPDNYVLATGQTHSIRMLLDLAFRYADLEWEKHVEIDKSFFRPAEINVLIGDSTKARKKLGWEPQINFATMVKDMLDADLERNR